VEPVRPSSSRLLATVGLALVLGSCNHGPTPADPLPAPAASTATAPRDAGPAPPINKDGGDGTAADAAPDLTLDLAERARQARARFGADVRVRTVDGAFLLVEVGRSGALFDQAAALLERSLPPLFHDRLRRHLDRGVTVFLFWSHEQYLAFWLEHYHQPGDQTFGVYRRSTRDMLVDTSGGPGFLPSLLHESLHPLLQTDFHEAPLWFEEGVASQFEWPVFTADGGIRGMPRGRRQKRLEAAFASKMDRDAARVDALFGMSTLDFQGCSPAGCAVHQDQDKTSRNAAIARSVCAWLDEQGKLWPFYRAWRDGVADDPTGEKTFARVMGGTPAEMNAAWVRWAR
jgi:hypothetical protein